MSTEIANTVIAKSIDKFVETKLSKSEVIDILLDDIRKELGERLTAAREEYDQWHKTNKPDQAAIRSRMVRLMKEPSLSISDYDEYVRIEVDDVKLRPGRLPKVLAEHVKKSRALKKQKKEAEAALYRFNNTRGEARREILRSVIGSSKEGQAFLSQLGAFKERMRKQLTGASE